MDTRPQGRLNACFPSVSVAELGASFVVTETEGRIGGVFGDLSSAMRFARYEGLHRGRPLDLRFDESLALIRAAGFDRLTCRLPLWIAHVVSREETT